MVRFCLAKLKRQFMKKLSLKRTFALATSAIALTTAFVGCTDYTGILSEEEIKFIDLNNQYDKEFVKHFGTPDPDQTWGMSDILQPISLGHTLRTRGGEAKINTNRNQWVERWDKDEDYWNGDVHIIHKKGEYKDAGYVLAHDIKIPGWPNDDNRYYASTGPGALQYIKQESELDNSLQPVGDITEYEIQYVSAWFRTHKIDDPTQYREDLHLSDFFIQNVSIDSDQFDYEPISSADGTGHNGENIRYAKDAIANANNKGIEPNVTITTTNQGSNENLNYKFDQLCCGAIERDKENLHGNGWVHINNFNNNNSNYSPEDNRDNPDRTIMYVTSAGTEDFACRASQATDNAWCDNWVLVRLTWTEKMADGQMHQREGYYLAFDYSAQTNETKIEGDHYFSNWILKITPGHFNPNSDRVRRVFCEDLGGTFDFDFNDVVFDIAFDGQEAIISVQAAGGTMPIWISKDPGNDGTKNMDYEVHNLLGNVNGEMMPINVQDPETGAIPHTVAIFRTSIYTGDGCVKDPNTNQPALTAANIPVYVKNTKNANGAMVRMLGGAYERCNISSDNKYDPTYDSDNQFGEASDKIVDGTEKTRAPRAFATRADVKWMKEYKDITKSYSNFPSWVHDVNFTDTRVNYKEWYDFSEHNENIYTPVINMKDGSPVKQEASMPATWVPLNPAVYRPDNPLYHEFAALEIAKYSGTDQIMAELNKTDNPARQITFTVVFRSTTKLAEGSLKALLVPADVKEENGYTVMSYKGKEFLRYNDNVAGQTFDEKADGVIKSYKESAWQEHYNATWDTNGVESYTYYTYINKFSFVKSDLYDDVNKKYCDYIFLYVKKPNGANIEIPVFGTDGSREWFIHY